jgi:hypothetical protein
MRKSFFMALVAVILMAQFADARLFDRWRARHAGYATTAVAAAPTTPAPAPSTGGGWWKAAKDGTASAPAPAPAPPAPTTPATK